MKMKSAAPSLHNSAFLGRLPSGDMRIARDLMKRIFLTFWHLINLQRIDRADKLRFAKKEE